ncbi:FimV family protein [Roseateles sp. DC23W]|uniref:FimV family protein n=1 Tax=Pelomonas dachongensis TaxID=3299029 RepID=A0ABW7EUV6_9BURK
MPFKAPRPTLLTARAPALALCLGLAAQAALALGVGRPQVSSALGQPLDVSIALNLSPGETLTEACARVEVSAGDARVPAGLLQVRIEGESGQQRIRVQSLARIEEPALRVTLALGCPLRLTREFNAFVDPPAGVAPSAPVALPSAAAPAPAAVIAEPVAEAPRPQLPAPRAAAASRPKVQAKRRSIGPRLVLERPEVLVDRPTVQAAAREPASDVTPELEAQITALEQTVAALRAGLESRLRAEAALAAASAAASAAAPAPASAVAEAAPVARAPLLQAPASPAPYRDPWTWLWTLGVGLVAGAGAYHLSRWRDERRRRELTYQRSVQVAEGHTSAAMAPAASPSPGIAPQVWADPVSLPDEGQHTVTRPQPRPMAWSVPTQVDVPVAGPLDSSMLATRPMPVHPSVAPTLAQELTVADELLDLCQQVDFLNLLGQHDAAADLLAARLKRGSLGPLPLLMLMDTCQRRGEPDAFAELARQFEQQVRAPAPSWAQSQARGRGLDGCASVIAHLQVVWSEPSASMQMLQDLLARGGGPGVQQFELPAYGDLLLLYSVARDLFEAGQRSDGVDLMLPLDSQFGDQT